jgi:hypothetical protein
VIELAPAAERGEHWWPVALAIMAVAGLHVVLPARYRIQPVWVLPVVLLALLAVLIAADPGRIDRQKTWLRVLMGIVIAVITLANLLAAGRLVVDILTNNKLYAVGWADHVRPSSVQTCPAGRSSPGSSSACRAAAPSARSSSSSRA